MSITIPQNDCGYELTFTLYDSNGNLRDISTYSAKLIIWSSGNQTTPILNEDCDLVDGGTTGRCKYTVQADDFNTVGSYKGEIELTKTGIIESSVSFSVSVIESPSGGV